jgi:hypothetical protein
MLVPSSLLLREFVPMNLALFKLSKKLYPASFVPWNIFSLCGFFYLEGWPHTDKNENQIFLIVQEIQSGAVAKSGMAY